MSRKSLRELERAVSDLEPESDTPALDVFYRFEPEGEPVDREGNPVDPDPNADLSVAIVRTLVIEREEAQRRGYETLGPADVPSGMDCVRVAWDEATRARGGDE